jgi:hypothetical protein
MGRLITRRDEARLVTRLRGAALSMATDADLCALTGLTPDGLAPYREIIEQARASALMSLKFQRMREQARRVKRGNE